MRKTNYLNLIALIVVGILIVLGCGKSEADKKADAERQVRPAKFMEALKEFSVKPAKAALVQQPYLIGKVAVLSSTDGKSLTPNSPYGYSNYSMLPNLVDTTKDNPEDVKTVVLEDCRTVGKTVYRLKDEPSREIPATLTDCEMTIIDQTIQAVIFVKKFQANPQANIKIWEKSESVSVTPSDEMNAFLKSLPQK